MNFDMLASTFTIIAHVLKTKEVQFLMTGVILGMPHLILAYYFHNFLGLPFFNIFCPVSFLNDKNPACEIGYSFVTPSTIYQVYQTLFNFFGSLKLAID